MFELFDPQTDYVIREGVNLPHWYQPGVTYFVTFRTEDSIPTDVRRRWHAERTDWLQRHGISDYELEFRNLPIPLRKEFHERFSREYMELLDKGFGACVLARPELSSIVADSLFSFDSSKYHLGDFVVMPNHVHVMVCLLGETEIEAQCTSWKRFTARRINQALKKTGRFWQEESFDHLIRSAEQFAAIQHYIASNPLNLNFDEYFLFQFERSNEADGTRSVPAMVAGTFQVPPARHRREPQS
ncbi:MAG: transposase [Planctomycetaceae bacterium]